MPPGSSVTPAIERARSVTKGVAFGSVAAVAVAGVYLSQALPGHTADLRRLVDGAAAGAATAGTVRQPRRPSGGSSRPAARTPPPLGTRLPPRPPPTARRRS